MFQMLALPLRSVASPALPNSAPPQVLSQCQPWYNHGTAEEPWSNNFNHGTEAAQSKNPHRFLTVPTMVQNQKSKAW